MAEAIEENLDGLFSGDDLLDLLDMVQNKQDSGEDIRIETLTAEKEKESSAGSSEEAFQKLTKG